MPESRHLEFFTSILCGEAHYGSEIGTLFNELGLIHLILITTHHLHFFDLLLGGLQRIWRILTDAHAPFTAGSLSRTAARVLMFSAMAGLGGAKIYLLRAWIAVFLRELNALLKLNWRPVQRVATSGLICLIFCKTEMDGRSLAIGWAASLAFAVHYAYWQFRFTEDENSRNNRNHPRSQWFKAKLFLIRQLGACTLLYLFLLPLFISYGWPSAWIVLCNSLLAPLLSLLLVPIAVAFRFIPLLKHMSELTLDGLMNILRFFAERMPAEFHSEQMSGLLQSANSRMIYLLSLSAICLYFESILLHPEKLTPALPLHPKRSVGKSHA